MTCFMPQAPVRAMRQLTVTIRPIDRGDIPILDEHLPEGPEDKHSNRLKRQEAGLVTYLIAWSDGLPMGHALLVWKGAEHKEVAAQLHDCPEIDDLYVHAEFRSRGVGTELLKAAEQVTQERGYRQIGLAVGKSNLGARALYQRCGYLDSGVDDIWLAGTWVDRAGKEQFWGERCVYLVKPLG